ncbi:GTA-gp10 family protein [Rhizobium sp. LC145]|uniref:GTA-gp10 family protein n=1 Tax=Rhizobium sp. LC145 TaxID=1120688 RepID=UPI000629DFDC|nr:GTA-gp10 family protein [Rhizobium sp. LC145]KKX28226.1 hypothetical protein YH62_19250 [Rhizobium sp. LC145]TKT58354.1 gene transfer agent family protein [Rhizobiaceae bacterium LC148]
MANSNRGSVSLKAGDKEYTLSFSVNALCELEDAFGMPIQKIGSIFNDAENITVKDVRKLICAALHDHHPEVEINEAGKIATDAGLPSCMEKIGKAFQLAFPEARGNANPRIARSSAR